MLFATKPHVLWLCSVADALKYDAGISMLFRLYIVPVVPSQNDQMICRSCWLHLVSSLVSE